ncbi:MAG: hypothetical protein HY275_02280 [Gemmatimonadetes bacterium]|nr:hypothetical protein [Gemmatimonadota bacterium]
MNAASPDSDPRRWRMLALLAVAELCGMSLWFTGSVAAPPLAARWGLAATQVAWLTSAVQLGFVLGTALVAVLNIGDLVPARWLFATWLVRALAPGTDASLVVWSASAAALLAALLVATTYHDGPYPFAPRPFHWGLVAEVFRNRRWRLATGGYLGHMFELYSAWTWLATWMAASATARGDEARVAAPLAAFVAIAAGSVGCVWGGRLADRKGRAWLVTAAMATSGACAALIGVTFGLGWWLVLPVAIVWGASIVADSPQFSVMVTESVDAHAVGTALSIQTSLGFLLTMVSIQLVPPVAQAIGWRWALAFLAVGPVVGIWSIRRLGRVAVVGAVVLVALASRADAQVTRADARPPRADARAPRVPANAAARVVRSADRLVLVYDGDTILSARVEAKGRLDVRSLVDTAGGAAITQVVKLTAFGDGARVTLAGVVTASVEGFAVEAEPRTDALPVVRVASGRATNALHRGVYDRRRDWMLSVDAQARVRVSPGAGGDSTRFTLDASGFEVALRFRPRWFGHHRGLARFEPWKAPVTTRSVAGWTSWFAFLDTVREAHVARTAAVLGRDLAPWGYTVMQLDDGYQRLPLGPVANWLGTNAKFPGGVRGIRALMTGAGLEPGIWTNVAFEDTAFVRAHPALFVAGDDGRPAYGNWVGFSLDGSHRGALDTLVRPIYRGLKAEGFTYFKLDALRHLRYEGYNSLAASFGRRGVDREQAFRDVVAAVRGEIGLDAYLLACWGIRPELAGLVDAVRVGTDGFGYGGFAQYNSWNNVVWRNDPDHVELAKPDGIRAATLASLTGSLLMLTDPPEAYTGALLDAARRVTPVLFTVPEQGYDVDPSRSRLIAGANTELSGSGSRPFDADRALVVPLTLLDIARPFGTWSVLARTGGSDTVRFAELGLPTDAPMLAFEFWSKRFLGAQTGRIVLPPVAPNGVQVVCLRAQESRPQLLATSRHITCGGVELVSLLWTGLTLRGRSQLVAGDPYDVYLTEPAGWRFEGTEAEGATVVGSRIEGGVRVVRLLSERGGEVRWRVSYHAP